MAWLIAPACTVVTQGYGCTDYAGEWSCRGCSTGYFHAGIDISGGDVLRTPVLATRSGVVNAVGIQYLGDQAVAVRTDEGVTIEHGHLDEARVTVGQRVAVGDVLGLLGTKGNSTGPHLHVEVRVDGPFQGVAGCPQNDPTRDPTAYLMEVPVMRTMLDSVTARNIPVNTEIVAGYVEGMYTWSAADWARFPNAIKVTIAIWNADADVLDIETGDATPAMGPAWVARQRKRGAFPTVYCNSSTWPLVQNALSNAGFINGQHYDLWLADYTQVAHCPDYAASCQYADPGPVDLSLCQDWWPRQGAPDMTNDEHNALMALLALTNDVHNGMGTLVSNVPGQPPPWILQILNQVNTIAVQSAPANDKLDAIRGLLGAIQTPSVDVHALATEIVAKLPGSGLDPQALAVAVASELGMRLKGVTG